MPAPSTQLTCPESSQLWMIVLRLAKTAATSIAPVTASRETTVTAQQADARALNPADLPRIIPVVDDRVAPGEDRGDVDCARHRLAGDDRDRAAGRCPRPQPS